MARTANQSPDDQPKKTKKPKKPRDPNKPPQVTNAIRLDYHCAALCRLIELPDLDDDYSKLFKRYAISFHIQAIRQIKSKSIPACPQRLEQLAIDTLKEHGHRPIGQERELEYQAGTEG